MRAAGTAPTARRGGAAGAGTQVRRPRAAVAARAAAPDEWTGRQFTVLSTGEAATAHLAKLLAAELRPGDSLCLKGDQGAGKSAFAREFVCSVYLDPRKAVPAPVKPLEPVSYTDHSGPTIQHMDLRGAPEPSGPARDALLASFEHTVSLIENAEKLQEWRAAPEQRLALWMRFLPASKDNPSAPIRLVTVVPHTASWELRARMLHANIVRSGGPAGLVMLGDDMAASLIEGFPESLLLAASRA